MSDRRGPNWKWAVCGVLLCATMLNYMDRQTLSLTAKTLEDQLQLDDARYGRVERGFSYAFALGSIFFGIIVDRFRPFVVYPIVFIGWSAAGILTPFAAYPSMVEWCRFSDSPGSGEFHWLLFCRTALGFFEAGHWPCALVTARTVLTTEQRPWGNAILQSGASMGAILTPIVVKGLRSAEFGWETPFWVIGIGGLLWLPMWLIIVSQRDFDQRNEAEPVAEDRLPFATVVRMFLCLLVFVASISFAWQFLRAWLPKFLEKNRGYTPADTENFTSAYFISADLGCLLAGYAVTLLVNRGCGLRNARLVSAVCCVAMCMGLTVCGSLERGPLLIALLLAFAAGTLGLHPHYYALVQALPKRTMGFLSGVLAAISWLIVGEAQRMIGDHIKATGSYDRPMTIAAFATLLAPLAILLMPRTGKDKS